MNLTDPVSLLPNVGPVTAKKLKKLEINTVEDLLLHIPSRYTDLSQTSKLVGLTIGELVTIKGQIISIKNIFTKAGKAMQEALISDGEHELTVIWFNQLYLVRTLPVGTEVSLSGKVGFWKRKVALVAPAWEKIRINQEQLHTGRIVPIYPETAGVSSKWLRQTIHQTLIAYPEVFNEDFLDTPQESLSLISLKEAVSQIHFPLTLDEAVIARERLAFNELFSFQLESALKREHWRRTHKATACALPKEMDLFYSQLPFTLTKSQERTISEVSSDMAQKIPMNRLLEGDVGSGKTVVAAAGAFIAVSRGLQTVIMAPTQILAEQHEKTIRALFEPLKIRVSLVTSSQKTLPLGRADILIGTHALLHKGSLYKEVGLIVIDEQHRFGVAQRAAIKALSEKNRRTPHVLTMTATPIPRTIALTVHGDLDLSTLDEMPVGRTPIKTWVIPPKKRGASYKWIEKEIKSNNSQAFIVCPLIEESEEETMKNVRSVKKEFERLQTIFPSLKLALLHGKMKREEKSQVLDDFKSGNYDILVTTPVVEVGIDIPNATIMMIEAAERFGLAQLHQLRGRVGRGVKQSYCLLMTENTNSKVQARLKALTQTLSGRALAELDLELRGPGQLFGLRQAGISELKIANWQDRELIIKTREFVKEVLKDTVKYQKVLEYFKSRQLSAN